MDKEDKLLQGFFAVEKREVADKGFSRKVMKQLPHRTNYLSLLWTGFIVCVALFLFTAFNGWQHILSTLQDVCISMLQQGLTTLDSQSLLIAGSVLSILGIRKICTLD